jgi:hypothetical protein
MVRALAGVVLLIGCGRAGQGASALADAGGDVCDPYAASMAPNTLCIVDSDCHSGYLVCVRTTIDVCRDPPEPDASTCVPPWEASLPICPTTAHVGLGLCQARFQLGCATAADCGPAGFTCVGGQCQQMPGGACDTASDCPQGWSCASCCPDQPKACEAPFAVVHCPACRPTVDDAGADAT